MINYESLLNSLDLIDCGLVQYKVDKHEITINFYNKPFLELVNITSKQQEKIIDFIKLIYDNQDIYEFLLKNNEGINIDFLNIDNSGVINLKGKTNIIRKDDFFICDTIIKKVSFFESNIQKIIFDKSPYLMTLTSATTRRLIDANHLWLDTFGFTKDDAIGKTINELNILDEDSFQKFNQIIASKGEVRNIELILKNKYNQKINLLFSLEKLNYNGEEIYLASAVDVTHKILNSQLLIETNQKIKFAFEALRINLFMQNLKGDYLWFFASDDSNLVSDKINQAQFFSNDDESRHNIIKNQVISSKETKRGYDYIEINGNTKFIEYEYFPNIDEDANCIGIIGFIRDISSELDSENKLNTYLNNIPIGIAVINYKGKIIEINNELVNYIHKISNVYTPFDKLLDVLEVNMNILISIIEHQAIQSLKNKSEIKDVEIDLVSNNNQHLWFNITTIPIAPEFKVAFVAVNDITYKKEIETDIKKTNLQLRNITNYMEIVREEERKKVAFWIHDDIGQVFTGLKIDISWLELKFKELNSEIPKEKFTAIYKAIDDSIQRVREISYNLRPPVLDHFGICIALEFQIQDLASRAGISLIFTKNVDDVEMEEHKKVALFRIMQELFINIIRHSKATEIELTISLDFQTLIIDLYDNGIGFGEEVLSSHKSFGLMAVRERLKDISGEIEFFLSNSEGTRINIKVPI